MKTWESENKEMNFADGVFSLAFFIASGLSPKIIKTSNEVPGVFSF